MLADLKICEIKVGTFTIGSSALVLKEINDSDFLLFNVIFCVRYLIKKNIIYPFFLFVSIISISFAIKSTQLTKWERKINTAKKKIRDVTKMQKLRNYCLMSVHSLILLYFLFISFEDCGATLFFITIFASFLYHLLFFSFANSFCATQI